MGKRGRPRGAFDKSRDYAGAVAKMRALTAGGTSDREAAETVGAELRIPASTLRKHLAKQSTKGPRSGELDLSGLEVLTREQAEEIRRSQAARRREREESLPPLTEKEKKRLEREEKNRKDLELVKLLNLTLPRNRRN